MRYFIELSFKGTQYHGWQSQPNAITIQKCIEKALSVILHQSVSVTGAGRTDTGVHARNYIAHFDIEAPIIEMKDLIYKMNALIPTDISIHDIFEVLPDAHARFSALSRSYRYVITMRKDPFLIDFSWYLPVQLNLPLMNLACEVLKEHDDFTSFSKLHTDVKNNRCIISSASWTQYQHQLTFEITANRFLRNMVRSVVGTMIDVGKQKINLDTFRSIIEGKNRRLAGLSVPPQGLVLYDIQYPANLKL